MIVKTNGNELYAIGTIWSGDGMWFVSELNRLEKQYSEITIKVHLYGGSVFDGNLMCNAVEASQSDITIDILGLAASMGGVLALSAKKVRMVENGYLMLHAPKSGSYGEAKDHESSATLLRFMEKNFVKKLSIRMQITEDEAKKIIEKDTWYDAETAQKAGLISEIIPSSVETILPIEDPQQYGEIEVYNLFSNILINPAAVGMPQNSQQIFNDNMKKLLITAFALTTVTETSSDTAVMEALQEEFGKLKSGKDTAEADLKNYRDARITALLDGADLTDPEKEIYKKIGETSGVEALTTVLASKQKQPQEQAPNINAFIQNNGGSNNGGSPTARADWDFKKWQQEDPKGLEKMSETSPEEFKKLFNANYNR